MDQITNPGATAALAFIDQWFGATEQPIYISSLPNDKNDPNERGECHVLTRDPATMAAFIAKYDRAGRGMFVCVSTIRPGQKRNKENVAEIPGLWADIDFKDVKDTPDSILKRLKTLPLPPSLIVSSGNGYHVYWCFKEAITINVIDGAETIERVEAALKLLADLVGGDTKVTQVAALMRVPGTHNSKRDEWKDVTIVEANANRYDLDDIDTMLWECAPIVLRKVVPSPTAEEINPWLAAAKNIGFKPPIDAQKRLAGMVYMGGGDAAIHDTQISVSASLLTAGVEVQEVVSLVLEATRAAAGDYGKRWNWKREEKEIRKSCDTWLEKHPPAKAAKKSTGPSATIHKLDDARPKETAKPKKIVGGNNGSNSEALHLTISKVFFDAMKARGRDFRMVLDANGVEQCWRYDGDVWSLVHDVTVYLNREIEAAICGMQIENMSSLKLVAETRGLILRSANLVSKEPIEFDSHGMVPVKGYLIDPLTLQLIPMRKEHYCTWHLGDIYDKNAKCPHWEQMLQDSFSDRSDAERAKVIALQQEFLGAALIDHKPKALRRAMVYQGPSDCGKTELIKTMSGLLTDSPISTPLADLNAAHGLQEFAKRVVWVLHEAFDQGVWHLSSRVKAILSGDPQSINPKNHKAITMLMRVVAMWATNSPPKFKESTDAILIRLIIVRMKVKFVPGQLIGTALEAKKHDYAEPHEFVLATEKPGMLNWALAGLQRVLPAGRFSDTEDSQAAADELRLDSNYMAGFVADCIDFSGTKMLGAPDLHMALASWWKENRGDEKTPPGADAIGRQISALHDQRIGQDNKKFRNREGVRFHPGITLNDIGRDHFTSELIRLSAMGSVPRGVSLEVTGPGRAIPADWDDHPQIKVIVELAKAAEAATITPAEKVMAAEESAMRAQEHADRLSKFAEVAKARAAYHK